ncbi:hypothetical protein ASG49_09100 [Marmoricola sp. Leaf446]|uniref:SDR family NAD(P)-dependent oxidoreductase n=1 Tax=Marmoricola sp. Leaf446 TaxID=1736379 RepID=UPI0006F4602B|nr:SDR family NAD(P)-dependent oxidoreductase [Marmoricola sp. Leaf446]KQT92113.1 hypothetical protein ASG49_09100 [Marmoricola sp. Leaf446]
MSPRGDGWTPDDVPDLTGRRALVTGATTGTGREVAMTLARHGATLVVADRDLDALADLVRTLDAEGAPRPVAVRLDLADLDSVRDAAGTVLAGPDGPLDLLVLDEGARPRSVARAADDLDPALTARFLGPFALTGLLLPRLRGATRARVVTVVSPAHRLAREVPTGPEGAPDAGDDQLRRRTAWAAPAEAALAALMFALELDTRARQHGLTTLDSLAAVAGLDASGVLGEGGQAQALTQRARRGPGILRAALGAVEQRSELAPWPALMAATADLPGSTVVGPGGPLGLNGAARIVNPPQRARDRDARSRLWELAEAATGVEYLS